MKPLFKTQADNYTFYGAAFGFLFPVGASIIDIYLKLGQFSIGNFIEVQISNPLHWIIDSAPFWLGLFARVGGIRQDKIDRYAENLEKLVERKTKELNKTVNSEKQKAEELRAAIELIKENEQQLRAVKDLEKAYKKLKESEQQLTTANQQIRIANQELEIKEKDLRQTQDSLKSKLSDLEKFNKLMVGRELEMIKLKKEVNSLLEKAGQTIKYKTSDK